MTKGDPINERERGQEPVRRLAILRYANEITGNAAPPELLLQADGMKLFYSLIRVLEPVLHNAVGGLTPNSRCRREVQLNRWVP